MTIVANKQQILGEFVHGFQISCHNPECHGSNFMKMAKRLPDQVIANKFRERGWEVNASGKDCCPNCIVKKRGMPKGTKLGPRIKENRLIPIRDTQFLNADTLLKVATSAGLPIVQSTELEHAHHRKFRIRLKTSQELNVGILIHAESEIVEAFAATLVASYLKYEISHTSENNLITLEMILHWYVALEQKQIQAAE